MAEQTVGLDPWGRIPEPGKGVRITPQSASGMEVASMGFGPPLVECISNLVSPTQMMSQMAGGRKSQTHSIDQEPFFTISGWDAEKRVLTAKLK